MKRDGAFLLFNIKEDAYSSRGLWLLLLLFVGSLIVSALASPFIFQLVHWLDPDKSSYLANKGYADYFDRTRWLCVLIAAPFIFKSCGLFSASRIGLQAKSLPLAPRWLLYGFGMMLLVYACAWIFGAFELNADWTLAWQARRAGAVFASALVIGLLEEIIFRGMVFRMFYTAFRPSLAILLSSALFAAVHFKMDEDWIDALPANSIGMDDGLIAAWKTLTAFFGISDGLLFVNLLLAGVLLHQAFLISRNLWACIGLHAGWVIIIMSLSKTLPLAPNTNWLTGRESVVDGALISLIMICFIFLFAMRLKARDKR